MCKTKSICIIIKLSVEPVHRLHYNTDQDSNMKTSQKHHDRGYPTLSLLDPNSKQLDMWSSGPSTIANSGLSSENFCVWPWILGDDVSTKPLVMGGLLEAADRLLVGTGSNISVSIPSDGKMRWAGTPSPSFLFKRSIFAQRNVASERISKVGAFGGPKAANEIVLGLFRLGSEYLSLVIVSKGGEAGMVSRVGLTDAVVDGGPLVAVSVMSLSRGGGLRMGLRTRHESAQLIVSV